jgi:hypothetical protein
MKENNPGILSPCSRAAICRIPIVLIVEKESGVNMEIRKNVGFI